jgi:hypothetical protein
MANRRSIQHRGASDPLKPPRAPACGRECRPGSDRKRADDFDVQMYGVVDGGVCPELLAATHPVIRTAIEECFKRQIVR